MDYFIDQIPLNMTAETRKSLSEKALSVLMWADWMCGARDVRELFDLHPSFLACELIFLLCSVFTLIHAFRNGGRYVYLWIGLIIHGFNTELIAYFIPDVDNFWHAQSTLMFFGRRMPVYIMLGLYPLFDYVSSIAAKKARLPWWAEGPLVGLCAVLLDIPYDIMGVKLLWWTWHDTDPNIFDRMYHVPWTSYYFHAAFACSFTWVLRLSRRLLLPAEYDWKLFPREFLCAFIAGASTFWVGAAQFVPIYHVFHDLFNVPTECCVMVFLTFYAYLVWKADRNPQRDARPHGGYNKYWFDELCVIVVVHYLFYMGLVLVADPVNIVSTGLHEAIGPCNDYTKVNNALGLPLRKNTYLCPTRFDEPYFDFHCIPDGKPPKMRDGQPVEWYTICGTEFNNRMEYIFVIWSLCFLGLAVFYQLLGSSGETPEVPAKIYKKKEEKILTEKKEKLKEKKENLKEKKEN